MVHFKISDFKTDMIYAPYIEMQFTDCSDCYHGYRKHIKKEIQRMRTEMGNR